MQLTNNNDRKRAIFNAQASLKVRFASTTPAKPDDKGPAGENKVDPNEWTATLEGYALKWNVLSSDRGGYVVRLIPGGIRFTDPCFALYHHEYRDVIGSTGNGTLRMTQDEIGLKVEIDLPDTTVARDVCELVDDGYVTGMSFGMTPDDEGETSEENGVTIVTYKNFEVDEVTVTAIPAFVETSIDVKSQSPETDYAEDEKSSSDEENYEDGEELARHISKQDMYRLDMLNLD